MEEKEFYSKVCVAGNTKFVVNKAIKEEIKQQISYLLATILARDKEVVAVMLKVLTNGL